MFFYVYSWRLFSMFWTINIFFDLYKNETCHHLGNKIEKNNFLITTSEKIELNVQKQQQKYNNSSEKNSMSTWVEFQGFIKIIKKK